MVEKGERDLNTEELEILHLFLVSMRLTSLRKFQTLRN